MKQMIFNMMSRLGLVWRKTRSRFLKFKFFILPIYKAVGLLFLRAALLVFIVLVGGAIASTITAIGLAMVEDISWFGDSKFLSFDYWRSGNKDTSRSDIVRNLGLVLAAFIGLAVALWRLVLAGKQQTLAERGLITDRFNEGVKNLGSKNLVVRLGGIHALWRLTREIPDHDKSAQKQDIQTIADVFLAFVRAKRGIKNWSEVKFIPAEINNEHESGTDKEAPNRKKYAQKQYIKIISGMLPAFVRPKIGDEHESGTNSDSGDIPPNSNEPIALPADIQTILNLFGNERNYWCQIFGNDVSIYLHDLNLERGRFNDYDFSYAYAQNTNMSHAIFARANLSNADLKFANCEKGFFLNTNCENTDFSFCLLMEAEFELVRCHGANFKNADLTGVKFKNVKGLTQGQIDSAVCDPNDPPELPEGLTPPSRRPEDVKYWEEEGEN